MELSKLAIIGLVTLGFGAIVLAGYVVYQIGRNRIPPPSAPVVASMPVPETEAQPDNVTSITSAIGFEHERRRA